MSKQKVDFGFKNVDLAQKAKLVKGVFNSVSDKYDLMNDVMSFGAHHFWKRATISLAGLNSNSFVLDLASGTGDLGALMRKNIGTGEQIVISDINSVMLKLAKNKLFDKGYTDFNFMQINAQQIPFADNTFDCVTIAFGLRNVTEKEIALKEICRVVKKGGRLIILEFSKVDNEFLDKFYQFYLFNVIPKMGQVIAKDENSYRYLAESIYNFPNQQTLKQMILDAGFNNATYYNLSAGVVSIHKGIK